MSPDELYHDHILDHAENPRGQGSLAEPTLTGEYRNALCGDSMELDLEITDGRIAQVRWRGNGCAISQAAASLLSEAITGESLAAVCAWDDESILTKVGLPEVSYARRDCALMFIQALRQLAEGATFQA